MGIELGINNWNLGKRRAVGAVQTPLDIFGADLITWLDNSDAAAVEVDSSNRVFSVRDKSVDTVVNVFTNTYGAAESTIIGTNMTMTYGETVGGRTDCAKAVATGGNANHRLTILSGQPTLTNELCRYRYQYFIQADNSELTRTRVLSGSATIPRGDNGASAEDTGVWIEADFIGWSSSNGFVMHTMDDTPDQFWDSDGDTIYFRELIIDTLDGSHFFQETAADQPLWDGISKITYDGVSESLQARSVAAYNSLTEGAVFYKTEKLLAANISYIFSVGDTAGNNNRFHHILRGSGDAVPDANEVFNDSQIPNVLYTLNSVPTYGVGTHNLGASVEDGVATTFYGDGVAVSKVETTGTDLGDFYGDLVGADGGSIGKVSQLSTAYSNNAEHQLIIINRPITAPEAVLLNKYFDSL